MDGLPSWFRWVETSAAKRGAVVGKKDSAAAGGLAPATPSRNERGPSTTRAGTLERGSTHRRYHGLTVPGATPDTRRRDRAGWRILVGDSSPQHRRSIPWVEPFLSRVPRPRHASPPARRGARRSERGAA